MDCKSIQCGSSSHIIPKKYDVFVSFRGEDTRNNFVDHLFAALHRKGIVAFRDDRQLPKGETISPELLQAIENSQFLIVVLSKNYATSTWCLRELEKIVHCVKVPGKRVLPVFYDVNPSEVRKQSGSFAKAFMDHEEGFKYDLETVQRWREALTLVANLSGWDIRHKPQNGEIEKIVKEVTSTLSHKFSSLPNDIVGMHSRVEEVEKLLVLGSDDSVQVVGICGMGGIGKSTLALALCDRISHQYDACCFIDDVSKIYKDSGPTGAQQQLLRQIQNEENLQICSLFQGTSLIRNRLRHLKALIVLDNVDQIEQLEKLAMNRECLGSGSKIIIISRNEHILRKCEVDEVYNAKLFNRYEAHQLFCKKAFNCDYIKTGYEELMNCALTYAQSLPLAIKVLGSFLFGRDVSEWRSALARLRESPTKDIMEVLRISFDGLEEMEKEIFLDIACFYRRHQETDWKKILDYCEFYPHIGMRVLIDKSLITIEYGRAVMHDLLRELGMTIVTEKSPKEPGKWSRIWWYGDLRTITLENKATKNIEAIDISFHRGEKRTLKAEVLSKMSRLRLLILKKVQFSGILDCLSDNLRYLEWKYYPFRCLPTNFQPDKLVELILPKSSIERLWTGIKALPMLKTIDLSDSRNLIEMSDLRGIPKLERLNLKGCIKLKQIDPSIGLLTKLAYLNLTDCKSLMSFPRSMFGLKSLQVLHLSGCSKSFNNQLRVKRRLEEYLKKLDKSETAIQSQSRSFLFYSRRHKDSVALLFPSLHCFSSLRDLDLSFCNLLQIPDAIGSFHFLEKLNLSGNNFVRLPSSFPG